MLMVDVSRQISEGNVTIRNVIARAGPQDFFNQTWVMTDPAGSQLRAALPECFTAEPPEDGRAAAAPAMDRPGERGRLDSLANPCGWTMRPAWLCFAAIAARSVANEA